MSAAFDSDAGIDALFEDLERLRSRHPAVVAGFEDDGDALYLSGIEALPRGRGHGSAFMTDACRVLDAHGAIIELDVEGAAETPAAERLVRWYRRFGFEPISDERMRRDPPRRHGRRRVTDEPILPSRWVAGPSTDGVGTPETLSAIRRGFAELEAAIQEATPERAMVQPSTFWFVRPEAGGRRVASHSGVDVSDATGLRLFRQDGEDFQVVLRGNGSIPAVFAVDDADPRAAALRLVRRMSALHEGFSRALQAGDVVRDSRLLEPAAQRLSCLTADAGGRRILATLATPWSPPSVRIGMLSGDDGALPRIHETSAPDETFVRLWITRPDGEGFRIEADPAISTAEQPSGLERLRMMAGMDA